MRPFKKDPVVHGMFPDSCIRLESSPGIASRDRRRMTNQFSSMPEGNLTIAHRRAAVTYGRSMFVRRLLRGLQEPRTRPHSVRAGLTSQLWNPAIWTEWESQNQRLALLSCEYELYASGVASLSLFFAVVHDSLKYSFGPTSHS